MTSPRAMSVGRLSKAAIERLVAAGHARVGVCQKCWDAAYNGDVPLSGSVSSR